jgi:hypothetical protein
MKRFIIMVVWLICIGCLVPPLAAKENAQLPEVTTEGLHLVKQDNVVAVYVMPGASLEAYDKILLIDAFVAFAKDWQKDYNREQISVTRRISDSDMQKIKEGVAEEFKKEFSKELTKGGYKVVTEVGPDVMILRPAIINLTVTAPDVGSTGRSYSVVNEAGTSSLYMELYDSVTNAKFAEVLDNQIIGDYGIAKRANRATNKMALNQTLRHWAGLLTKRLDEAHGKE